MAARWSGIIEAYRDRLPVTDKTPIVTLCEGNTPLVDAPRLSDTVGARVMLKVEGANPTGSFKDRGMTMAISKAAEEGAKVVVCASTGNTSASAAAYAARAEMLAAVIIPDGHVALGKLAQALIHGAKVVSIRGSFDDALHVVRELGERGGVTVVNSINPFRIEGQKTAAFEICDALGAAPDVHCIPVGNAGNITAYWKGYGEYARDGVVTKRAADARLAGRGLGAARDRRARRAPGDDRDRDPDRQSGELGQRDRGARRVGRPHRCGHRRPDPRGVPAARLARRRVRRTRVGGVGRRTAPGGRDRTCRPR